MTSSSFGDIMYSAIVVNIASFVQGLCFPPDPVVVGCCDGWRMDGERGAAGSGDDRIWIGCSTSILSTTYWLVIKSTPTHSTSLLGNPVFGAWRHLRSR